MPEIKTTRWYHDRIIDLILASEVPLSQNEISKAIGYSASWVSIMVNSDAFKERLTQRKAELTDPVIVASINERLDALARRSLDKLLERIDSGVPQKTSDLVAIAKLAVGDKNTRPAGPLVTNQLYVVHTPPVASSTQNWLESAQGRGEIVENTPQEGALLPDPQLIESLDWPLSPAPEKAPSAIPEENSPLKAFLGL
jgi:hypothetical protein